MKKNVVIAVLVAAGLALLVLNILSAREVRRLKKKNVQDSMKLQKKRWALGDREVELVKRFYKDRIVMRPPSVMRGGRMHFRTGPHSITTRSKDGPQVVLKFELGFVCNWDYRWECLKRFAAEGVLTEVNAFVTESMQKLIETTNVDEIAYDAVRKNLNDKREAFNDMLREPGDPWDMIILIMLQRFNAERCPPDDEAPLDDRILPTNPIIETGEHAITTQAKDGAQVILRFELALVGYEEFREDCFSRMTGEDTITFIADLVTYSMQKLIQESTVTEITLDAIKQRVMRDVISELNEKLKEPGDPENIKFFKGVLIHKLMIQSG